MPDARKVQHLEPGAGHYGIFAGKSWRLNIRPLVLDFIDENAALPDSVKPRRKRRAGCAAADCGVNDPVHSDNVAV